LRRYDRTTGNSVSIKPQPTEDEVFRFNWNTPYFMSKFDSKTLYVGGNYVFKSTDMGNSWKKVSPDLTRQLDQNSLPMMGKLWPPEAVAKNMSTSKYGNLFALSESPFKQGMIYAGTDDGLIWITEDDGQNWTRYDKFPGVPEMTFVNYVLPSQHDMNTVYACFDGRKNSSDFTPYLIKSTDKGKTWTSIASNLPSGTVYAIQEDHEDPNILFIGTEWGVWATIDGGKKWVQLKNGLPTIQVKDITIQRRENDLVVGTFGRGFYVLKNYAPLRELSKAVNDKEAHIFEVKDALLYFPSSNLNYQGEIHWRSPNPNPAVHVRYYVRDGFESLKQKRVKKQKASENTDNYFYPTEDELLAERQEKKPNLIFTFYDSNDQVMRKITTPLRKGYQTMSWDMSYLNARGPKVPPGAYKVALDKEVKGVFTRLVEPTDLTIVSIPNALGTPNYQENFDFIKEVNMLSLKVTAARGKISDMNTRLSSMKEMLNNMPTEASVLVGKINAVQDEVNMVAKALIGGFGAKNTVSGRLRFALFSTASAQVDITGSQREQYGIARDGFSEQEPVLNDLFDVRLPQLEQEFVGLGGVLHVTPPPSRR
jgi:flagellar hook assembly protein FlgD